MPAGSKVLNQPHAENHVRLQVEIQAETVRIVENDVSAAVKRRAQQIEAKLITVHHVVSPRMEFCHDAVQETTIGAADFNDGTCPRRPPNCFSALTITDSVYFRVSLAVNGVEV